MQENYYDKVMKLKATLEANGFEIMYDATKENTHGIYVMVKNAELKYDFSPCVTFENWRDLFYLLCGVNSLYRSLKK